MNKRITPPSDFNFNLFNVDELADYFSNKTYPEITETLAVIDTHIKTARKVDCKIHPEVKLINKVFRELKQALEKGMLKEERFFFGNDFSLLCFLVDDKPERYKAARVFLERSGEVVGKDKAKSWLSEKEQEIKKTLNADKIEIQY